MVAKHRANQTRLLRSSILDRLIDSDPQRTEEAVQSGGQSWSELIAEVRRDVQDLLNTRQHFFDPDLEGYPEAKNSLLTYGFPEFDASNPQSSEVRQRLKVAIEQSLKRFEPRLLNIRVINVPTPKHSRVVQFRLEAHIRAQPRPRRITFDAVMDVNRLECRIQEQG